MPRIVVSPSINWKLNALIDSSERRGSADRSVVQPVILGNRVTDAARSRRVDPGQCQGKVDQLMTGVDLTSLMQAAADLQVADVAQIAVDVLDEFAIGCILRLSLDAQSLMQIRGHHGIPDLLLNERQLLRIDPLGVGIS